MPYLLLVDDEPDGREALRRFFEREGHEVGCAGTGEEALQSIMSRTPDVVILDLFMPRMDGVRFLEVMRSYLRLQPLRVVILTAFPESPLVEQARQLGVTRLLAKSQVSFEDVLIAVNAELSEPPGGSFRSHFTGW